MSTQTPQTNGHLPETNGHAQNLDGVRTYRGRKLEVGRKFNPDAMC